MRQKQDFFTALDGRVKFVRGKYNITSDPIFLAAFVDAAAGMTILDVGIGTGGAALALLSRVSNAAVTGIDVSEDILAECAANAKLNGRDIELIHGDILKWRTNRTFDAVMTNPPYFVGTARAGGMHHNADLTAWVRACLRRVKPRGYFYCIIDAAASAEVIAAIHSGRAGDVTVVPLFGTAKRAFAERVLISARAGSRGGTKIFSGIAMNDDRILRGAQSVGANFLA